MGQKKVGKKAVAQQLMEQQWAMVDQHVPSQAKRKRVNLQKKHLKTPKRMTECFFACMCVDVCIYPIVVYRIWVKFVLSCFHIDLSNLVSTLNLFQASVLRKENFMTFPSFFFFNLYTWPFVLLSSPYYYVLYIYANLLFFFLAPLSVLAYLPFLIWHLH